MAPEMDGNGTNAKDQRLIPEDAKEHLQELFKGLKDEVVLEVFTKKGHNQPYNEYLIKLATEIAELTDKIEARVFDAGDEHAAKRKIAAFPALLVSPDRYPVRFLGAPLGEEGKAVIESIIRASAGVSGMTEQAVAILGKLKDPEKDKRHIRVFTSPTCPYCPGQAINAFKAAIERPDMILAEAIDSSENSDLADEYGVGSVPHTVITAPDGTEHTMLGLFPEDRFVAEVVAMQDAEQLMADSAKAGAGVGADAEEVDIVIMGAGPAGLTAGIYAERSGLSSVVLEKDVIGGQVTITPLVENYPGFAQVAGKQLMDIMSSHAREYTNIREGEGVTEIKVGKRIEVITSRGAFSARALIIATGATWRKLGAPGEDEYFGRGVSYCSTCDGYMYKDKRVAVIGGGNSALTDALHLRHLGAQVTLVHRRDAFRAEKHLQDSVEREGIKVEWNAAVKEITGKDGRVTGVTLSSTAGGDDVTLDVDGVFVAVGHNANSALAQEIGVTTEQSGFIKVDRSMRTNIPRIYAAGDITGGVRQIVTAIGEGSTAALAAFEDLSNPYWKK